MTPAAPIDASALAQAKERLEAEVSSRLEAAAELRERSLEGIAKSVSRFEVDAADLRLVLDALKEAERVRHKMDPTLSAKVGHPTCGKCGVVIPEPETCCRGTLAKVEPRGIGFEVLVDPAVPPDEMRLIDPATGLEVGRITGTGDVAQ